MVRLQEPPRPEIVGTGKTGDVDALRAKLRVFPLING